LIAAIKRRVQAKKKYSLLAVKRLLAAATLQAKQYII